MTSQGRSVLELTVNNHPGVMSHVCGLFSRRAYNLEGILVLPIEASERRTSKMWLLVNEDIRLEQVMLQTQKLVDVLELELIDFEASVFQKICAGDMAAVA